METKQIYTNLRRIYTNHKLLIIYIVLVILSSFSLESKIHLVSYVAFALLVGFLFFEDKRIFTNGKRINTNHEYTNHEWSKWLIVIPIVIILVSRILPFAGFESPLGYDTGIYKKFIEDFANALPFLPDFNSGIWAINEPIGLYLITDFLYLIGFDIYQILFGLYILFDVLIGIGIYLVVKKFSNINAALCAFLLFAISVTQFQAYWFMYYKQIVSLFLMLIAFLLLKKKSYLVIPVAGFMGGLHPMTFLIFGLVLLANFIFSKYKKYLFISGLSILTITFSLYLHNPWVLFNLFPSINPLSMIAVSEDIAGGKFFDLSVYIQLAAFYLPFAILGFIYLIQRRKFDPVRDNEREKKVQGEQISNGVDYLFFWFCFNFLIVYLGFFFHNRFIISLDVIVIILAGFAISQILGKTFQSYHSKLAVLLFLFGTIYFLFNNVITTKPLISQEELNEIKSLAIITKENTFVMATNAYYAPWVYGYSQRRTIAPGLFEHDNKWAKEEWNIFWFTDDLEIRHKLLDRYERPLYIFVGDRQEDLKLKFEEDPTLVKESPRVYKYK